MFGVVIGVATLLCMEVYRRGLKKSWIESEQQQATSQQRVYSLIVGYVCHEVRNPLHVLKSSFEALTDAMGIVALSAPGLLPLSEEDQAAVVDDGKNAMRQMEVRAARVCVCVCVFHTVCDCVCARRAL